MIVLVLYDVDFKSKLVAATVSMAAPTPARERTTMHNAKNQFLWEISLRVLLEIESNYLLVILWVYPILDNIIMLQNHW